MKLLYHRVWEALLNTGDFYRVHFRKGNGGPAVF